MFWDIFLLAFGIAMVLAFIHNWRYKQKNDPISDELRFLIENTLIPLKKETPRTGAHPPPSAPRRGRR